MRNLLIWMPWPPPKWVLALAVAVVIIAAGIMML